MRRIAQTLAVLAAMAMLAGGAVVALGLYNVSARVGHLPGVSWILHTTFRNSVRLRAPVPEALPDLDDPALIELGARHYEAACRDCHAAPGETRTATMTAMLPAPPHVTDAVADWQPRHMHWIVANGIKMSGMPAWPAARDDDVWPVVAFLRAVQRGMTGADYAALTQTGGDALAYCAGCHGDSGSVHVPRLDIQTAAYLEMSLRAYLSGERQSGIMAHAVSEVPEDALAELAARLAETPPPEPGAMPAPLPDLAARGRALALADPGERDVPSCSSCHGPDAEEAAEDFPSLAGLPATYLRRQLELWRDGERGGGRRAHLMRQAARDLTAQDIAALAAWFSGLPPARRGRPD